MAGLNPAQLDAVRTLRGPLLVLAGAGSGKTRVVTFRIAELIKHGTPAPRILAVTFTNKAAKEMQGRAKELLGRKNKEQPEISTFHSLCVRILRRRATLLGYPEKFTIFDRGDQESFARAALREIQVAEAVLKPGDLLFQIGQWKSHAVRPDEAGRRARTDKEHLASAAYRRYQSALKAAGGVDFDDLLLCTEELFDKHPQVRREEAARFDHVLIDEYQDTNGSQYRIVKALAGGHRNLCVVGDDDQAIYGWRGAEVTHILRFKKDWPEAKVVRLEENYRSTAAILDLANRLIVFNQVRHEKVLRAARPGGEKPGIRQCQDEEDEAKQVVEDIVGRLREPGTEPRDIAILFRTNEQPRPFEQELRRLKLPYVLVGGMSFYDRKEVRDILSYVKLLAHPTDEPALRRIINRPARGLGESSVALLVDEAVNSRRTMWDVLRTAAECPGLTPSAIEGAKKLRELIERYTAALSHAKISEAMTDLVTEIKYQDELARQYKEPADQQSRWAAVEEVINSIASYEKRAKKPSVQDFLDEMVLGERDDSDDKDSQLKRNAIALMTLHSAKGLEFPQVYMVGMEEGFLPHVRSVEAESQGQPAAIDEERRLCYVGFTRAQDRLTMSMALSRMKWGKERLTVPSRFLFEVTGQAERGAQIRADAAKKARAGKKTRSR